MHAEKASEADTLEATINYFGPDATDGGINDLERETPSFTFIPRRMRIRSARERPERFGLERTGFTWLNRPTACRDFSNPAEVEGVYLPEAAELVKELTGAELVLVFSHIERDAALKASTQRPLHTAHIDFNVETIRAIARRHLPSEAHERRLAQRIVLVNVWRPLETVESSPLALCDATSVAREDLLYGRYGPMGDAAAGVPNSAGWNVVHNPAHRWFYLPRMKPEEVLVFKLCDTDPDRPQWTAHSSFDPPGQPAGAQPRRSIEVRTLAFIP